jgi:hypothetical protein
MFYQVRHLIKTLLIPVLFMLFIYRIVGNILPPSGI